MIYVYRKSVKTPKETRQLKLSLNEILKYSKWNFDLEDCDKILRVDSPTEIQKQ